MGGVFATVVQGVGARRRAWRRARNLRAGKPATLGVAAAALPARCWLAVLAALLGAVLIASHARSLGTAAAPAAQDAQALATLQPVLPGLAFAVPAAPGASLLDDPRGALLVLSDLRPAQPVRIDLCEQVLAGGGGRLVPLRIGASYGDVARWVARNDGAADPLTLRNIVLAGQPMPRLEVRGMAAGAALDLSWHGGDARWVGDAGGGIVRGAAGKARLAGQGWLLWGADTRGAPAQALRLLRRPSAACPEAGELVVTRYQAASAQPGGRAQVLVFPNQGGMRGVALMPGHYRVPLAAPPAQEDGALFDALLARGLLRLGAHGMVETAPRDLADWRSAPAASRAADLHGWDGVRLDEDALRLLERLYRRADGAYVREQIRVFNSERRLLAWRSRPGMPAWRAAVGTAEGLPPAGARLFDRLPQGWAGWQRVADWPPASGQVGTRLTLELAPPAQRTPAVELLLAGRLLGIEGARLERGEALCRGRACARVDEVRALRLLPLPGARRITLEVAPLDLARAAAADGAYRHLVLRAGRLAWQPLAREGGTRSAPAAVALADRDGAGLWAHGVPSAAAGPAGLAPLLGLRAEHEGSVAGMLGRLQGAAHTARLSIDLGLQGTAQAVLECVGLRRGRWDGARCHGGEPVPTGRTAGLVLLDAGKGDLLAAAGALAEGLPSPAGWEEVRDFDRADPARSLLRHPALQHDGGAERAPGSTFKIVSALGLELAARRDPRLDALLGGLPLDAINGYARERGYAFRTDAARYPLAQESTPARAHITNFRDQHLDRRARDGRLGLSEALTYSLNTWFAWTAELSDASLFGRPAGGAPSLRALDPEALAGVRPVLEMARRVGFERPLRLDGGLLPPDYAWRDWDALQSSTAGFDPVGSRHALRQMAIGLRMQATPLHMALAAAAVGEGRAVNPRLLLELDGRAAAAAPGAPLGVRLDRIRAGLHGVVERGTAAAAFRDPAFDGLRPGLYGKTGTAPAGDGALATVWFTGWLEPGSIPGETRRLAFAVFVSRSKATGGEHAAPVAAALLHAMLARERARRKAN